MTQFEGHPRHPRDIEQQQFDTPRRGQVVRVVYNDPLVHRPMERDIGEPDEVIDLDRALRSGIAPPHAWGLGICGT